MGSCTATRVAGSVPEQPHVSDCQCTVYACQGGRSNSDDDDDGDDDSDDDGAMIMTDIDPGVRGPRSQLSGPRLVVDENALELLEL